MSVLSVQTESTEKTTPKSTNVFSGYRNSERSEELLFACAKPPQARTPTPPPSLRATWCQLLGTRHCSCQAPQLPSSSEPSESPPPASAPDTADHETTGPPLVSSSLQLATPPQT